MSDEFDIIEKYFLPLTQGAPGAFSLSDDAAALSPSANHEIIISTDTIVSGVHFLDDEIMANVAAKLLASNLSDLAAMGARPIGFTLSCAWTHGTPEEQISEFANEMTHWVGCFEFPLLGGDTVTTSGPATFTLSAMGEAPTGQALRRNSAKPGDTVYVTGTIGDGALGLMAARGELGALASEDANYLATRYRRPTPRVEAGQALVGLANAAIDISDGLLQDLGHITKTSGVSIEIDQTKVPISKAAQEALETDPKLWGKILTGGDDYELAFTASNPLPVDLGVGVPVHAIGTVSDGPADVICLDQNGAKTSFKKLGYNHFA